MAITILVCNNFSVTEKRDDLSLLDTVTNIIDFLEDSFHCYKPVTPTDEDLINHFGTPQEIIGDYIREQDTKILLKQINRNYYLQIILRILFISAFVCCILYGINCYRAYLHCIQSEPVYMYEEISTDNVNK